MSDYKIAPCPMCDGLLLLGHKVCPKCIGLNTLGIEYEKFLESRKDIEYKPYKLNYPSIDYKTTRGFLMGRCNDIQDCLSLIVNIISDTHNKKHDLANERNKIFSLGNDISYHDSTMWLLEKHKEVIDKLGTGIKTMLQQAYDEGCSHNQDTIKFMMGLKEQLNSFDTSKFELVEVKQELKKLE